MKLINTAIEYNQSYGFNILPLNNKVPNGEWMKWQEQVMSVDDICAFNWQSINGIGSVSGINKLRCLDFDKVSNNAVLKVFLRSLGLPAEYSWTVASGSGKGYHIWFYCNDDPKLFKILGGEKSYYKFFVKPLPSSNGEAESAPCDHIELRWKNCQTVLPPSLHPSGQKYKFLYNGTETLPKWPPSKIPGEHLINTLLNYCSLNCAPPAVPTPQCPPSTREDTVCSSIDSAAAFLEGKISNYDDWMRIGFALASLGEKGREYFLRISSNNPKYNDTEELINSKFDGFLKDYNGEIKTGTLYEIARRYGWQEFQDYFWRVEDNKVKIFSNRMINFLQHEGFAKMIFNKDYIFIRDKDNIISEVSKITIKDHLLDHINKNTTGFESELLLEYFIRSAGVLSGETTLECLHTFKPEFISGTKDKEYFFFSNCFIEVTRDYIKQKDYSELKGKIWENQKAEHEFQFTKDKSEFEVFIENVCNKSQDRINALRSAIGYLLVSYKDPASAKAIIFIDEKLSDNAFGRSGKGLVSKAISRMKNALKIDGKNFTFERSFMFQAVNQDTQLIIFDDVKKKFSFEKLFSILTEGITIEKKNKNEYRVPYERSPKILITTNHTVEGTDDSSIDRQFVVEFSDYYNAQHKPSDEFGHLFFDEWNETQWIAFYNYMAECCRYYLMNGLKNYEYINLTKKKLIDSTAQEFAEFITELELNEDYNKKELFEKFKKEYEDFGQVKQQTLTKWMSIYANLYGLVLEQRRSGLERFIRLRKKGENESKTSRYKKY